MRHALKTVIVLCVFAALGLMGVKIHKGYSAKKEAEARIQILPDVSFTDFEENQVSLQNFDKTKSMVIIYFHRNCEHCQYEAREIGQNDGAFKNCQLLMVSANDSVRALEKFCNMYNLWEVDNIEVLIDKQNRFKQTFGRAIIPSVYIYDRNQKLKKNFFGETKLEAIINEIKATPEF